MSTWQPISTAPREGYFLALRHPTPFHPHRFAIIKYHFGIGRQFSHWMLLPDEVVEAA